jgi:membrane-bound lytic murein transglycosylase B
MRAISFIFLLLSVFSVSSAWARADLLARDDVQAWIADFSQRESFKPEFIIAQLKKAKKLESSINSMDKPIVKPPVWFEYSPRFLSDDRIGGGTRFWRRNAKALKRAADEYGVPPEIIVAIIGVETNYGRNTGRHRLLDSLTTLAFDYPRRGDYFRKELEQLFILARDNKFEISKIYGSYAGAMGLAQFMPRSYRNFAVDYDADGRIDLWDNDDAIGSVAAYLKDHGWAKGAPIMGEVSLTKPQLIEWTDVSPVKTGAEWRELGVSPLVNTLSDDESAHLFTLEVSDNKRTYYIAHHNFRVILKYNRSKHYAAAVTRLAEEILARRQQGR